MNGSGRTRSRSAWGLAMMVGVTLLAGAPAATASSGDSAEGSSVSQGIRQAAGWNDCYNGEMCLFQHANGEGTIVYWLPNQYNGDFRTIPCSACGGTFDNQATSWWNRTGQNFCVSDGYWGGDPDNTMPAGTSGNFTPDWNDRASSIGYQGCP